ncbi:NRPS [Myotisia sp. PD_48]|nr:NRPS [Myotisia sp. PD_48]
MGALSPADFLQAANEALDRKLMQNDTAKAAMLYESRDWILNEIGKRLRVPITENNMHESYISLGGDSISAIGLSVYCRRRGVDLPVKAILGSKSISDMIAFSLQPKSRRRSSVVEAIAISHHVPLKSSYGFQEFTGEFGQVNGDMGLDFQTMNRISAPMTEMQLALIQGSQAKPGTNIICFSETCLTGMVPLMKKAWTKVIEAEPIFRTKFRIIDGVGILELQESSTFSWEEVIVYDQMAYQIELDSRPTESEVTTSFKVVTLKTSKGDPPFSTIIWRVHHALIDGYSAKVLYQKVLNAVQHQPFIPGTPFPIIAQGIKDMQDLSRQASKAFWDQTRQDFASASGTLLLPLPASPYLGEGLPKPCVTINLPTDRISICTQQGVSLAALYHGAWALVLSLALDSDSVVFGAVFSGRSIPLAGADDTIGPLINTLPLHVAVDRALTTTEYLQRVFERMIELDSFQFSLPQDGYTRDFSSTIAAEFEMPIPPYGDGQASCFSMSSDIPLSIFFRSDGGLRLCYDPATYRRVDIERMGELFRNAILTLVAPNCTIDTCMGQLVSSETHAILRQMGNCTSENTTSVSVRDDLVTIFERVVARHPDLIALERDGQRLSYMGLDRMAGHVAKKLSRYVKPGSVVCVYADGSINWIVAIYGILKLGAVYSPLDKALPSKVRNDNYQTADAKMYLTPATADKTTKPASCTQCLSVEELLRQTSETPWPKRIEPKPSANAYICFTSGSTGKPKGVICAHAGLVAFQRDLEVRLFAKPGNKISQIMSPAFDGSIHEIFSALSYGATLVLGHPSDPLGHLHLVDSAILTPSIARTLKPEDYPRLSNLYLVGEVVPQQVNDTWASAKALYNMYGPTEGTGGATIKRLVPNQRVTIGVPNPSTRIYVLDRQLRMVPPGVVGELYLAGVQIARGYIGRPEETAKRFFIDTICPRHGEMMYRTGDRGYWNSYGEIEFQGRQDRQIKLQGFRMDLNDLEVRLGQAIPEATAVAIAPKGDCLVAMLQPKTIDLTAFKTRVSQFMPIRCVPRHVNAVDKIPMTPIGKIDYKAVVETVKPLEVRRKQPKLKQQKVSEDMVAGVWRDILQLPSDYDLDEEASFLGLGGHSVAQLLVASKLTTLVRREVPLKLVIQSHTLGELARAVEGIESRKSVVREIEQPGFKNGEVTPIERDWLEKYETKTGSSAFNVSFGCELDSAVISVEKLSEAWNVILQRHEILRCRFVGDKATGYRRVYDQNAPQVRRVPHFSMEEEINRPFSLHDENPVRVIISNTHFVISISHIVCDLTTLEVLLKEVECVYQGESQLPTPRRYEQTNVWHKTGSASENDFWSKTLGDIANNVPQERKAYNNGTSYTCKLPKAVYQHVLAFTKSNTVTVHQIALASVAMALQASKPDIDVVLGAPYLNRGREDMETVGLFLEPLPIRIKYSPKKENESCRQFLSKVRSSSQLCLGNAIPWNQLLNHLKVKPTFPNHPILDTMVTFHDNRSGQRRGFPGMRPLLTWTQGAKFALMVEFVALSEETCLLRIEYDTDAYPKLEIAKIEKQIIQAMNCIASGNSYKETKERVQGAGEKPGDPSQLIRFGVPIDAL